MNIEQRTKNVPVIHTQLERKKNELATVGVQYAVDPQNPDKRQAVETLNEQISALKEVLRNLEELNPQPKDESISRAIQTMRATGAKEFNNNSWTATKF